MEINEIKYGFKLLNVREVKDVNIIVYEYIHLSARWSQMRNASATQSFSLRGPSNRRCREACPTGCPSAYRKASERSLRSHRC